MVDRMASPPRTKSEESIHPRVETLFATVVAEKAGENLEFVVERLVLPARGASLLSHSQPRDSDASGVVVAADPSDSKLYSSRDLGKSWTRIALGLPGRRPLERHFLTGTGDHLIQTREPVETVLCGKNGALLSRSENRIPHWAGATGIDQGVAGSIVLATVTDAEVAAWRSSDGGRLWRRVLGAELEVGSRPFVCRADVDRPGHWRLETAGGGWASEDDGVTWRTVDSDPDVALPQLGGLRQRVPIGDDLTLAIAAPNSSAATLDVHLLASRRTTVQRLGLVNENRDVSVLAHSAGSRAAVDGVFFTPSERTVLAAKDGILRWRLGRPAERRSFHYTAGDSPFATVAGRELRWFPTGFEPAEDDLIVFIHPQRTGGISLRNLLGRVYGEEAVYSTTRNPDYRHWPVISEDELAGYRVMAGHTTYIERPFRRRVLPVSLIRNPLDRVISLYRYRCARADQDETKLSAKGLDLESWVRRVHELKPDYISDGQTRFLCKAADADFAIDLIARRFFGVGVAEERSAFIAELAKSLRWPPLEDKRLNASVTPPELSITDSAVEFIRSINREDMKLYDFVLSVWCDRK